VREQPGELQPWRLTSKTKTKTRSSKSSKKEEEGEEEENGGRWIQIPISFIVVVY